ncbi:MAG: hypothetical protein V3T90_04945 [Anaerolineae bacterium]
MQTTTIEPDLTPQPHLRVIGQHVQQVGAPRERDVNQIDPAAQARPTEVRVTGEDGVVNHDAPVALNTPAVKVPLEDTVLDQQTGVKVSLLEMGHCDATADQLHHLVERAPFQIEPVENTVVQDNGLVDAAQVLATEPAAHDQWVEVKQTSDPRILNGFADTQALKHLM